MIPPWLSAYVPTILRQLPFSCAVARSPDLATGPTEGLRHFQLETVGKRRWHGRETMPQLGLTVRLTLDAVITQENLEKRIAAVGNGAP